MHRFWDKLGISVSFICLLHCILLPFVAMLTPALQSYFGDHDHTHIVMAIIIWPTALLAFVPAYKHHRKKWIPALAILGLLLITSSLFIHDHNQKQAYMELALSIIGSLILVYAHYQNYICNKCHSCHDEDDHEHEHQYKA